MTDSILYSLAANGVATLTLNRPELHNAIDDALIARLSELLDEVQANPDVRVLVLTGNGLSFSSGVDQDWMRRMDALAAYSLHCAARKLDDSVIATAQAAGIPVLCFTVNDRQDAEALLARGVTAVFSDRIDSLRGL